MNSNNIGIAIGMGIVIVLCVVFAPLVMIWSLNTIFPVLAIPYTFWTWLGVIGLNASIRGIFYDIKVKN